MIYFFRPSYSNETFIVEWIMLYCVKYKAI
jgi:hypothetical protein